MNDSDATREQRALEILELALGANAGEREALITEHAKGDQELAARVHSLLARREMAAGQISTGGARDADEFIELPDRIGAYKVEELIGQGGMGAVYRGNRATGDFDHEVAIKLIRPGIYSNAMIGRFERERQIMATLSHPHIGRLYDGGTTENGEPFFVMEYIDGTPITDWVDREKLDLNARLRLFETVCGAVRFAHQNLIIHRDLTPANVLVTADGVPKLIDFGIAKPHETEGTDSAAGEALNDLSETPGFAAPERRTGAPATTLTDVYSLGRLLSALTDSVEGNPDIDAVIARASATDAEQRYRSTDALIDDIQRLRDGRPVAARDGGRLYEFKKFVSRNKGAVAAAATIIILLVGGLTASLIGFQRAQTAQAEAEARFSEVRSLANTLLFDVYDAVDEVPGSTAARQLLAETAQGYLDALAADPAAPPEVRLEAGLGYMRLAHVMGGVGGGTLGLREQAMNNYERADEILTLLFSEQADDEATALALAELRYHRSNTMVHVTEEYDRGVEFAQSVREVLDRGCDQSPRCVLLRGQSYNAEGQNLYWSEEFEPAIAAFDRAAEIIATLDEPQRNEEEAVRATAVAYRFIGDATYYLDDALGSVREYDRAVAILEGAIENGLDNPDMQRDLAIVQWTRGGSLSEIAEHDAAVSALNQSYSIMEDLVEADPDDAGSLRLLAVIGGQRGLTLATAGRYVEAIPAAEASLEIRQRLSEQQPDESGFFRDVIIQLEGLGNIHGQAGNRAESCRYYRRTVAQFDELDARWGMSDFDRNDTYTRAQEALSDC